MICVVCQTPEPRMAGLVAAYKAWVAAHPGLVQDTEAALKWCSYLAAGYTNKSAVVSELLYTLGSLVTALHDRILAGTLPALNTKQYRSALLFQVNTIV